MAGLKVKGNVRTDFVWFDDATTPEAAPALPVAPVPLFWVPLQAWSDSSFVFGYNLHFMQTCGFGSYSSVVNTVLSPTFYGGYERSTCSMRQYSLDPAADAFQMERCNFGF